MADEDPEQVFYAFHGGFDKSPKSHNSQKSQKPRKSHKSVQFSTLVSDIKSSDPSREDTDCEQELEPNLDEPRTEDKDETGDSCGDMVDRIDQGPRVKVNRVKLAKESKNLDPGFGAAHC